MRGMRRRRSLRRARRASIDRMTTHTRNVTFALALALGAGSMPYAVSAQTAQTAPASATRKGVIKKIDDTTIVLTPSDDKKREATYALSPSAKRTGQCGVGDDVVVSYHYEKGRPVVTLVSGKTA
jgi:hypothetical protein